MSGVAYPVSRPKAASGKLAYYARVLRVVGGTEFKMKYADSMLGYVWSLAKPLAYFGVLFLVFGHLLKTGIQTHTFGLFLLIGILLYMFFYDAVGLMLPSIVIRGSILRRIAFPALIIPLSVSLTACITFCVNMLAVVVFIAVDELVPQPDWLLIVPLLLELYLFILGLGLIVSTLFVRFRDIAQIWEIGAQLLWFGTPIFYPVGILPVWAQKVVFLNPLVQVMQDVRYVLLGSTGPYDPTTHAVFASVGGRTLPVAIALLVFAVGVWLFRRDAHRFAERV